MVGELNREQRIDAARLSGVIQRHATGLADKYRARGDHQPEPLDEMRGVTTDPAILLHTAAMYLASTRPGYEEIHRQAVLWLIELGVDRDEAEREAARLRPGVQERLTATMPQSGWRDAPGGNRQ